MSPRLSDALLRAQSDERLVALARQGRERAFTILVERHRAPLLTFARNAAGEGRSEDVVQQALLQAWTSLTNGAQVGHVRGWLFQIVRHAAWRSVSRAADGLELPESLAGGMDPEDAVARRLEVDELLVQLAALPERQRAALIQTALEGRSRREVAEALGLTEGAVRQLVHRARSTLRAAASAITPMPLLQWAASGGARGSGPMGSRIAELVAAGGTGAGLAGAIVKSAAVVVATSAVAGGVVGQEHHRQPTPTGASVVRVVRERAVSTPATRPVTARVVARSPSLPRSSRRPASSIRAPSSTSRSVEGGGADEDIAWSDDGGHRRSPSERPSGGEGGGRAPAGDGRMGDEEDRAFARPSSRPTGGDDHGSETSGPSAPSGGDDPQARAPAPTPMTLAAPAAAPASASPGTGGDSGSPSGDGELVPR